MRQEVQPRGRAPEPHQRHSQRHQEVRLQVLQPRLRPQGPHEGPRPRDPREGPEVPVPHMREAVHSEAGPGDPYRMCSREAEALQVQHLQKEVRDDRALKQAQEVDARSQS